MNSQQGPKPGHRRHMDASRDLWVGQLQSQGEGPAPLMSNMTPWPHRVTEAGHTGRGRSGGPRGPGSLPASVELKQEAEADGRGRAPTQEGALWGSSTHTLLSQLSPLQLHRGRTHAPGDLSWGQPSLQAWLQAPKQTPPSSPCSRRVRYAKGMSIKKTV